MKKGWEVTKLGEICEISTGKSNTEDAIPDGEYAFFDRSKIIKRSSKYLFDCDAIIVAGEGQTFMPKFYSGKFDLHQRAYAIFNFNKNVSIHYVFKYLIHFHSYFEEVAVGATAKSLRLRHFQDLPIPIPPLSEQKRIVAILDEAFAAIDRAKANVEKNLRNARELFESYLQEVFEEPGEDWEEKRLGAVAHHSLGKMLDKNKNKGIPQKYLRNQNVRWFEFDLSDLYEMPFLENEKEKYTAIKGDVLICEGGYPGRAAIWQENYPIYFQKAIHRVRFHKPIYNKWFLYHLYLSDRTGKLKKYFSGTGIQHFTGKALSKYVVPLPPTNTVEKLVQEFDTLSAQTQALETHYRQKLTALEELKKSILQKAFAGELT
jgi:type I restriction enzyme S subunit